MENVNMQKNITIQEKCFVVRGANRINVNLTIYLKSVLIYLRENVIGIVTALILSVLLHIIPA